MPRPRVCVARFSRRLPAAVQASFVKEAEKQGLSVTILSPDRNKKRTVSDTLSTIERGTCGVFIDIRYNYGRGNYAEVTGVKEARLSDRLALRVANRLKGLNIQGIDYLIHTDYSENGKRDTKVIRDLAEVYRLTHGRLIPVLIRPCFGDVKNQVHLNMTQVPPSERIGSGIAVAAASFIESHL